MYDRGDFNDIINSAIEDELKTEIGLLVMPTAMVLLYLELV